MLWFQETLYEHYGQRMQVDEVLYERKTKFQHMTIFKNPIFGRVLTLDGVVQTTENDEFVYHEMLTHVPLFAHGNARSVLVIGGGDGGMVRDVLKHPEVEHVTMVEIDGEVVDMCKQYMPSLSDGAFDDPRLDLIIDDGIKFVEKTDRKFDVIISDSTDPIGPGEVLYSSPYFTNCHRVLNDGGVFVNQNGVAFMQLDEVITSYQRLKPLFKDAWFYAAPVPGYIGGFMTFSWATDNPALRHQSLEVIAERFQAAAVKTKYYNPEIHQACYALPQFIRDAISNI